MTIWQPPDLTQRIKFREITMPNMITVLNIADAKASSQRAAIADEDKIQFDSSSGNHRMSNNNLREDRKCLRFYPSLSNS